MANRLAKSGLFAVLMRRGCTMSWGDWGIVTGLLVLLTVFFFCMDLLYGDRKKTKGTLGEGMPDGHETTGGTSSKHAA